MLVEKGVINLHDHVVVALNTGLQDVLADRLTTARNGHDPDPIRASRQRQLGYFTADGPGTGSDDGFHQSVGVASTFHFTSMVSGHKTDSRPEVGQMIDIAGKGKHLTA